MKSLNKKQIKFIIKLKLDSNASTFDQKISTVLGQRRLNSIEIFKTIKNKIDLLCLNTTVEINIKLKVLIIVFELDDFLVYIKVPALTDLINSTLYTNKNFNIPGTMCLLDTKKGLFSYIVTPYMLYEIVKYKYSYENLDNINVLSFYKKSVSSLRSKGINIFLC